MQKKVHVLINNLDSNSRKVSLKLCFVCSPYCSNSIKQVSQQQQQMLLLHAAMLCDKEMSPQCLWVQNTHHINLFQCSQEGLVKIFLVT